MGVRMVLFGTCMVALVLTGCGKRPRQTENVPAVSRLDEKTAKTDSVDVFKKYYQDSREGAAREKEAEKTFSMSPPEPAQAAARKAPQAPAAMPGSYAPAFVKRGRYAVQVASLGSRTLAVELSTEFKEKGYPAYVTEITNPTAALQGTFYRVRIGGFATVADAQSFGENLLKPAHYDFWIDKRSNDKSPSYNGPSSEGAAPSAPAPAPATDWSAPPASPPATPEPAPSSGTSGGSGSGWSTDTGSKW